MYVKPCFREECEKLVVVKWKYQLNYKKYCSLECKNINRTKFRHSEETKQKMRHKHVRKMPNYKVWNKGLTKENNSSLLRMSEKKEGRKLSEEHKKKISLKSKGRKHSKKSRLKQSQKRLEYLENNPTLFKFFNTKPELEVKEHVKYVKS
jgi:hypothetical protein